MGAIYAGSKCLAAPVLQPRPTAVAAPRIDIFLSCIHVPSLWLLVADLTLSKGMILSRLAIDYLVGAMYRTGHIGRPILRGCQYFVGGPSYVAAMCACPSRVAACGQRLVCGPDQTCAAYRYR